MKRVQLKKPTPFKKGNQYSVGNKGYTIEDRRNKRRIAVALEMALQETVKRQGRGITRLESIARRMVQIADVGFKDTDAIAAFGAIANRVEGLPKQTIEQNTTMNARVLAATITKDISPADAAKLYVQALTAPDVDGNEE